MNHQPFSQQSNTPEQAFWRWFADNARRYRAFQAGDENLEQLFDELQVALDAVYLGLVFEFSGPVEGDREFIISADGIREAFPAVQALVDAAPELPDWKIIAFRQRGDASATIAINEVMLGPADFWFKLERDGANIGISLFIAGLNEFRAQQMGIASHLLLENALGEYDMEIRVSFIDRQPLPQYPRGLGLRPLDELPAAFDALVVEMIQ